MMKRVLGGPNITENLYFICLSEYKTYAYVNAVQISVLHKRLVYIMVFILDGCSFHVARV